LFVGRELLTPGDGQDDGAPAVDFRARDPDPEIKYDLAKSAASGRNCPTGGAIIRTNQQRAGLSIHLSRRTRRTREGDQRGNENRAAHALAALAKESAGPVLKAYGLESLRFGPDYIVPKPVDRACCCGSRRCRACGDESGVARKTIISRNIASNSKRGWQGARVDADHHHQGEDESKRIAFGEGEEPKVIRAALQVQDEGIGYPILLGHRDVIADGQGTGTRFSPDDYLADGRTAAPNYERTSPHTTRFARAKHHARHGRRALTGRNHYGR